MSMRVVRRLSTEPGSVSRRSPRLAASTSSRTNSGFPPERSVTALTVSVGSGNSSAIASASFAVQTTSSGSRWISSLGPSGWTDRSPSGRVVTQSSHGLGRDLSLMCRSSDRDWSSSQVRPRRRQRRHHQDAFEEQVNGLQELFAAGGRIKGIGFRRRRRLSIQGNCKQRQPRCDIWHDTGNELSKLCAGSLARGVGRYSRNLPQKVAPGGERGGGRVLLGRGGQVCEAKRERAELVDEAGLADSRLPDELNDLQSTRAGRVDRVAQKRKLRVATDDRGDVALRIVPRPGRRADMVHRQRTFLPFHQQRFLRVA